MVTLPLLTWEVLVIWMVVGLAIYFSYSVRHSKVQALRSAEEASSRR